MIGSILTRGLVMLLGYAYPAYKCFKTVEKSKPDIDQLRFWCQYWILIALLTVSERVGDIFISWVPMYGEAKVAFFLYLWWPKTKGTTYVYDYFFKPFISNHEAEIDRGLVELRINAENLALSYSRRASTSYMQTRVVDIFRYIASLSIPTPHAKSQRFVKVHQNLATPARKSCLTKQKTDWPPSPASSSSSSPYTLDKEEEEGGLSESKREEPVVGVSYAQKPSTTKSLIQTTNKTSLVEAIQIDSASQEMVMKESVRVTRARSRRTVSAPNG